jgi:phosphatidylglycerol:prolipoprotein diacylglycerol transferase
VHSYGVLIAVGFVLATQMIAREAKRLGEARPDHFTDLAFFLLMVGLVGSRVLFIIVNWREYAQHPIEVFYFWRGGLVFYGGFFAAVGYALWWCKRRGQPFFKIADIMIGMVAFNHVWGRLGCIAAGCCFGSITLSGVGIRYPVGSVVQQLQSAAGVIHASERAIPVHAVQLYEAAGELALFFVMLWMRGRKRYHGQLLLTWLALYPILRSVCEALRGDVERGFVVPGILSTSQFVSVLTALAAGWLFVYLRRQQQRTPA